MLVSRVPDVDRAYAVCLAHGGRSVTEPRTGPAGVCEPLTSVTRKAIWWSSSPTEQVRGHSYGLWPSSIAWIRPRA